MICWVTHQKRNVVGPLGSGWDRLTGWNSLCSAVFSLLHSVTAVMVPSGLPIVACVLCVSLLPSVFGKFIYLFFIFESSGLQYQWPKVKLKHPHHCNIRTVKTSLSVDLLILSFVLSVNFLKTPSCLPVSPWPRVFCVAADSCDSYWDTSGKHHGSQMCFLKFCCGTCIQRYCCNDGRYELTEIMQQRCPQR